MNINNVEPFALFNSINEYSTYCKYLHKKIKKHIISRNEGQSLIGIYDKFKNEHQAFLLTEPEILSKLCFCGYLANLYYYELSNIPTTAEDSELISELKNPPNSNIETWNTSATDPFILISMYYTLENLMQYTKHFPFSAMSYTTVASPEYYEPDFKEYTGSYYKLCKEKQLDGIKKTHLTDSIQNAPESIFFPLINYSRGISKKNPNIYYLNGFIPELSYQLADKSNTLCWAKFHNMLINNSDNNTINNAISLLHNNYFTILKNLYDPQNPLRNMLHLYKMEYGFGYMNFAKYLLKEFDFRFPDDCILKIDSNLLQIQLNPDILSRSQPNCLSIPLSNKELRATVILCRFYLSILLLLYNGDAKCLLRDIMQFMNNLYQNIANASEFYELQELINHTPNNWYDLYKQVQLINEPDIQEHILSDLKKCISLLSTDGVKILSDYLVKRYSPEYFFPEVNKLFYNALNK